jgi:membrane associated rhomboid family serine protease
MGIMDRDYYGSGSSASTRASWRPWGAAVWIIGVSCAVFLAQQIGQGAAGSEVEAWGRFDGARVVAGELWRVASAVLLHVSLWQLVANMLLTYWAGDRLAQIHGQAEYAAFYIVSGLIGYIALTIAHLLSGAAVVTMGSNAAAAATLTVFACHFPRQQVLLFFVIPMPVWGVVVLYVALDLLGALGGDWLSAVVLDGSGIVFGLAYYQYQWQLSGRWWSRGGLRPRRWARPSLPPREAAVDAGQGVSARSTEPASSSGGDSSTLAELADFEAEVDRVLAKLSQQGPESLTAQERAILFQASEMYKKRRR